MRIPTASICRRMKGTNALKMIPRVIPGLNLLISLQLSRLPAPYRLRAALAECRLTYF